MDGLSPAKRPPNPTLPYREDCWSEGETSVLIDAWGDRYVELSRGNLRQKHWQEVADAVNSRPSGARRLPRTDVQCKNRIDTLKKKYKLEKARIAADSPSPSSPWQFFSRLDVLIGPSLAGAGSKKHSPPSPLPQPPLALPLPYHPKGFPLPPPAATIDAYGASPSSKRHNPALDESFRRKYSVAVTAPAAASEAASDSSLRSSRSPGSSGERPAKKWKPARADEEEEGDGIRELARAIAKFGEIYERVEAARQRQVVELERQRMEFAKSLEFQRMQIFVDSQIKLEKLKRLSRRSSAGKV